MKAYTLKEFLNAMNNGDMKPCYAKIVRDYNCELIGYVGEIPSLHEEIENDSLYDLNKCNLEQLLDLINEVEFDLLMHDEESFNNIKKNNGWYDESDFLNFSLNDLQGGNLCDIESECFYMKEPTEESFRELLLSVIYRLEVYFYDYNIQFNYEK